jgi:hypothetical protein
MVSGLRGERAGSASRGKMAWLVSDQVASGKSVAAFCRGIADVLWKNRFREATAAKFVEVAVKPQLETTRAVQVGGSAIEIRLTGGRSLVVEPGFNANHLRALLAVLEMRAGGDAVPRVMVWPHSRALARAGFPYPPSARFARDQEVLTGGVNSCLMISWTSSMMPRAVGARL